MSDELPASIFRLHGWCTEQKAKYLYDLVRKTRADLSVELGVFGGRSLIPMALAHKHEGRGTAVGVDPWRRDDSIQHYDDADANHQWWANLDHDAIYDGFVQAVTDHGVADSCRWHRVRSDQAVDRFEDGSIGVLHQDGNHAEDSCLSEAKAYSVKIKPGGYFIMDDTDWSSTETTQQWLQQNGFELVDDFTAWKVFRAGG